MIELNIDRIHDLASALDLDSTNVQTDFETNGFATPCLAVHVDNSSNLTNHLIAFEVAALIATARDLGTHADLTETRVILQELDVLDYRRADGSVVIFPNVQIVRGTTDA